MQYFKTYLVEKKQLAPDVWLFKFDLEEGELEFLPGQYLILIIEEQRRLYSIASPNSDKNSFELIVKLLPRGVGSDYLRSLEIDSPAFFEGPAGFFTLKTQDRPKIFLAAGTGLAPIRSQIVSYLSQGGQAQLELFWGLPRRDSLYLYDELKNLARAYTNFHFRICLDQETNFLGLHVEHFLRGRVDKGFSDFVKENHLPTTKLNDFEYYLCASREIVESLKIFLQGLGAKPENIFFDKF